MSLAHGTKIIRDGLVFAFDIDNLKKSWKGKPTINYYQLNSGLDSINDYDSWDMPGVPGGTSSITSSYGKWPGSSIWHVNSTTGTRQSWASWRQCIPSFGGDYGAVRRIHAKVKMLRGSISSLGIHNGGGTSGATYTPIDPEDIPRTIKDRTGWYLLSTQVNWTNTSGSQCVGIGILSEDIEFLVAEPGIMSDTTSDIPWTPNSRSNTEALLDFTGNRTITVSNNYTSDNRLNFTSSTHSISLAPALNLPIEKTLSFWIRSDRPLSVTDNWEIGFVNSGSTVGSMFGMMYGVGNCQDLGFWGYGSNYDMSVESATNKWSSDGNWHQCVITMDTTRAVRVWIDGEQKQWLKHSDYSTLVDSVTMPTDTTNNFVINSRGSWNGGMTYVDLGQVLVYDRDLTNLEIKQNYEAAKGRFQ